MVARGGPGGRIPRDNRPVQAKGVGKNSKRHDLERPSTPGLHGSDLQQGDVQALEQGQRIAPVREQGAATPQPNRAPSRGGSGSPGGDPSDMPPIDEVIEQRLGGTLGSGPVVRPETARKAEGWGHFFTTLSRNSQASPGMRARAAQQAIDLRRLRQGPTSTIFDLDAADQSIDAFLSDQGF
ncbi:hypothetical protein [Porticoccus sp.]